MNTRNNDNSKGKISKKLQLTLNFKPEEILDIVNIEIEFEKLPNDSAKVIDYIDNQKELYISKLRNGEMNLNYCLHPLFLEVFKMKKFFMKSKQQSYAMQMTSINRVNESLLFCRKYIREFKDLLDSDIRGKILILFYLLCEVYQDIEVSDFSNVEDIDKNYKESIILFCLTFDFTQIQKKQKKACKPQLIKFYSSQLLGTMGLIQYELRELQPALENLDISIKSRLENFQDKQIVEKYLSNKQKVIEYQLVIYYLKTKKCSCLLKIGRYAECGAFGESTKMQIKQCAEKISSDTKQLKGLDEIIKQMGNLIAKIEETVRQSNNNAQHMLLDDDINDLLEEMKGNDFTKPKVESSSESTQYNENPIVEGNLNTHNILNDEQLRQLSPDQIKFYQNRIASLANIPQDSLIKNSILDKQDNILDSQRLIQSQYSKHTNVLRETDLFSLKTILMKDSFLKRGGGGGYAGMDQPPPVVTLKKIQSSGTQNTKSQFQDNSVNLIKDNFDSFADLNNSQLAKGQLDVQLAKQISSNNKLNQTGKTNKTGTQYTFSAYNFQNEQLPQSPRNYFEQQQHQFGEQFNRFINNQKQRQGLNYQSVPSHNQNALEQNSLQSENTSQGQTEKAKPDSKNEITGIQSEHDEQKPETETNKLVLKKLKFSPSKFNQSNLSFFFKNPDPSQTNQSSFGKIILANKERKIKKEKKKQPEGEQNKFTTGVQQPSFVSQQSANQYTEIYNQDGQPLQAAMQNEKYQNFNLYTDNQSIAESKQESIFNFLTQKTQQQEKGQYSERSQKQDTEQQYNNFLDTKTTEPNLQFYEGQKKQLQTAPYLQSTTLNTMSSQDQYFQFNTLQTQQRTMNTEQDFQIQNTLKTESNQNNNKSRKKYTKMSIQQFKPYEINQLIDGSQTERMSAQQSGILSTQVSPRLTGSQFQYRPEYYQKIPTQQQTLLTQTSNSQKDLKKGLQISQRKQESVVIGQNVRQSTPNSRNVSNIEQQVISGNPQPQQFGFSNKGNNQQKELLFKQISSFSQPRTQNNVEYQLVQYEQAQQLDLFSLQSKQHNQDNIHLRNGQNQRRQIHFNRQSKQRKSSLSPSPSIMISQVDQQTFNLSKQQSQVAIGSLQDLQINKQQFNEPQTEVKTNYIVAPKMNFEKLNSDVNSLEVSSNQKILSPTATTYTQRSIILNIKGQNHSENPRSPSFSIDARNTQAQFLQIPQGGASFSNLSEINNQPTAFNMTRQRKSKSTNVSHGKYASGQSPNVRNRFLSSHKDTNIDQSKSKGQVTPKTPHSFMGQFQHSFQNTQNTAIPTKSGMAASSTLSQTSKIQSYDYKPFLLSVSNDVQAREMLNQRPDISLQSQNYEQNQKEINRFKKSLSAHTRQRPSTATISRFIPSRSTSQHSNIHQQDKSLSQNLNNNTMTNFFQDSKQPNQQQNQRQQLESKKMKTEAAASASASIQNQIHLRQNTEFSLAKRPKSSTPYQQNQVRSKTKSQHNNESTSNLSIQIAKFASTQPFSKVKSFYNLNNYSEKGCGTASTKSRSDHNLDNLLVAIQAQPSTLQVVLQEIEFQKKFQEAMQNEKSQKQMNIKNLLTKEIEGEGEGGQEEKVLMEFMENASAIIDENNLQDQHIQLRDTSSYYKQKSQKKIGFSSSVFSTNKTISQKQIQFSKQPSIEKDMLDFQLLQDKSQASYHQENEVEESQESMSVSKNSQLNKFKSMVQQSKEEAIIDIIQIEENPQFQIMRRNSKPDLNLNQRKSRFAHPYKKLEDTTTKILSKVKIISQTNIAEQLPSFNVLTDDIQRRKSTYQAHEPELQNSDKNFLTVNTGKAKNPYHLENSNFTIQEEMLSGQLNYKESPDAENKVNNNDLLLLTQEKEEQQQEDQIIKMEDYSVSNNLKSSETTRQKRKNTDSQLSSNLQRQTNKSNSNSQSEINIIFKQRQSVLEQKEVESSTENPLTKQWHNQQHKLIIQRNQKNDTLEMAKRNVLQNEESEFLRSPFPSFLNQQIDSFNSPVVIDSCTSSASQYLTKKLNMQLKVPKNLEIKRSKMSLPSFNNLEVVSTLSRQSHRQSNQQNNQTIIPSKLSRKNSVSFKKISNDNIKSIAMFNQSVKLQSQTLIKTNLSIRQDDEREEKKKVVTLFKLLEETNKSYEVRDKLVNSISGLIKGVLIQEQRFSFPPITFYINHNSQINRVRLTVHLKYELEMEESIFNKFDVGTKPLINQDVETLRTINKLSNNKSVLAALAIQYGEFQRILIPINLTRGLLEHPKAVHSMLITIWPLVFKEFQRYMEDNHLIDITEKTLIHGEDQQNPDSIKIILYEEPQVIKQFIQKYGTLTQLNESINDSQNFNSDNQQNSGASNKAISNSNKLQYLQTLQNIPLDDIDEQSKSSRSIIGSSQQSKKSKTMSQINQKCLDLNLHQLFPSTSDSDVNRKLELLRQQYEDLNLCFQMFGGLEQYFTRFKSPDANIIRQKRRKKILSLIDLFEIQELKEKINSFLSFTFIRVQKEIGSGFCQDFNNEAYYRYYLKHILFLKKQFLRTQAGVIEFPDQDSATPLLLTENPHNKFNYYYQSSSLPQSSIQISQYEQLQSQTYTYMPRSPYTTQPVTNTYSVDRILDYSTRRKNMVQRESDLSSESSLITDKQNISKSGLKKEQRRVSIANSNVRKTIFYNHNYQKQVQFNYYQHLRETSGFVQKVLENYLKSSPPIILSFLKKNQGEYFLIIAKLVIKQEALFNKLFNENGEFDIRENYYFYVTARTLGPNLKTRVLLLPIEISQELLKPYFYKGEYDRGMNSQINKFIIYGKISKKYQLQLLHFFKKQIDITPNDKSEGTTKTNRQKIIFKDTIQLSQKMQVADWNSMLAQNLELYNIIYRQITQKSLFDGSATSEEWIKGYYHLFSQNFNIVYKEQIKSKRVALSIFHNYDDNEIDDDKMQDQNNKYNEQMKNMTFSLPKLNNNDDVLDNQQEEEQQTSEPLNQFLVSQNSNYEQMGYNDYDSWNMIKYYPHKIHLFFKKRREWFLTLGQYNKMRVNFNFQQNQYTKKEEFTIYFYDYLRQQKYQIYQIPLKIQNMLIRLIKWNEESSPYLESKQTKQFQIKFIQSILQFEKVGLTGSKPVVKSNKEMNIKNIIISSQKSIKEHLISNSTEILKYYQQQDYQFFLNINIYGKCICNLKVFLMRRPQFNLEQMYVFLMVIQPLKSKTKQIKFVFSLQDLILIDTDGELIQNLKSRFTKQDIIKVIKLVSHRIRMTRGLFGAYPIFMSEYQAKMYHDFKKSTLEARKSEQEQKQRLQNIIKQRAFKQQTQQLQVIDGRSPSNSISFQAQMVRSQRPSLFSKINSLFLKDMSSSSNSKNSNNEITGGRRKSKFFEESLQQSVIPEETVLSSVLSSKLENSSEEGSSSSDSSQSTPIQGINHQISPSSHLVNQKQKLPVKNSKLSAQQMVIANNYDSKSNFKRPPSINLGKESILTFSQKLIDMDYAYQSKTELGQNQLHNNGKIVLKNKMIGYDQSQEDQNADSTQRFTLQKEISSTSMNPVINYLKTKKEESNDNDKFNIIPNQVPSLSSDIDQIKSPLSVEDGGLTTLSPKQGSLLSTQPRKRGNLQITRNPNRKVSFVDQADELNDNPNKTNISQQQTPYQQGHGILKKAKPVDQVEQTINSSPKVHFKISEAATAENVQKVSSPKNNTEIQNGNNSPQNAKSPKNRNIIQKQTLQDNIITSPKQTLISNELQSKDQENIKQEITKNIDADQKEGETKNETNKQQDILLRLQEKFSQQSFQSIKSVDSQMSIGNFGSNSNLESDMNKNDQSISHIFQDLRVFKNIISRHDFSDGKQSLSHPNKGFLDSYMQKSRIVGQYVRRMANNEYVLITVKKDFILKCWDIQIYIPKTQRVLLSQISHSELIDCSFEFLNKNIATKLRFFYDNKNIKPFDNYHSFLSRLNQYSTNTSRMSSPNPVTARLSKGGTSEESNGSNSPMKQQKNSVFGSLMSKLKSKNAAGAASNVENQSLSPQRKSNIPNLEVNDINGTDKKLQRTSSFSKTQLSRIREKQHSLIRSSVIDEKIDLKEQHKLYLLSDQSSQNNNSSQSEQISPPSSNLENITPDPLNSNYLGVPPPKRSPTKKVSLIKLMNVEDDKDKDGERTNRTNRSNGQKSFISGELSSNQTVQSESNGENTPYSSASSKRSILKLGPNQTLPDSPSYLLTKMIESSARRGQRKLTFQLGNQQLIRQQSQKSLNRDSSQESIKKGEYLDETLVKKIESQTEISPLEPFSEDSLQLRAEINSQNNDSKEIQSEQSRNSSNESQKQQKDLVNNNKTEIIPELLLSKRSSQNQMLSSIRESSNENKEEKMSLKKNDLLQSIHQMRSYSNKKPSNSPLNELRSNSKKNILSGTKTKAASLFQKFKKQSLVHSNSLEGDEEVDGQYRRRSNTGVNQDGQEKISPQKSMKFQTQNESAKISLLNPSVSSGSQSNESDAPQKRNLKSLISQNQSKLIGQRNLLALVDFMKPKQFEKVQLQQKMQAITEEMDIAFMSGCHNERIENLVKFIEMKIWSNFLSQCEFRTDDKHFKVVLYFGNNRLSIQEQLFHDYIKIDQQNESVIEIDVELQESLLFVHRDTQLSTRVQLLQYFFASFKSIPYTMTSNFSFTVQNVIINKGNIKKFNVNVRELLNLFIAEGLYRFQTNYMSSKVSYSELKNLAYFLIHKIKSSNFLELMKTQEKNVQLDKVKSKTLAQNSPQANTPFSKQSKSSQNSLLSMTQLSDTKLGSSTNFNLTLSSLNGKKKQKQNVIILKDNNIMYFLEKVVNVQLRLIMRVSYFTKGHHFQLAIHKCGTTLSIIRNKSLKYFSKKIPFIQQFMKDLDLFDTALQRVCDFMKPKMILYFIIQHNLPLDQRYFSKITNTNQQKKKFSVFSSTLINISKEDSNSEREDLSDSNLEDDDAEDDGSNESGDSENNEEDEDNCIDNLGEVQESLIEFGVDSQLKFSNNSDKDELEHEYFSAKSLTPLRGYQKYNLSRLKSQRSQYYYQEQMESPENKNTNQIPVKSQTSLKHESSDEDHEQEQNQEGFISNQSDEEY